MIDTSDIYIFIITVFIAITFVSPGLYLSDELSPANQLHQLLQGKQLTFHEDKYGYYDDGTIDKSIIGARYVMTYSLLTPLLSLPIYLIVTATQDAFRAIVLILWTIIFASIIFITSIFYREKFTSKYSHYLYAVACAIILLNMVFFKPFSDKYLEVVSITSTNILLYGLFAVIIWKLICYLFCDNHKRIFVWIATMSCTSLLFWVGVLKDHVIVSLLFMIILYSMIKLYDLNDGKYLIYLSVATGLIVWERPELSIAIIPLIGLVIIYKYKSFCLKPLCSYGIVTIISMIPIFINNYIVTGSIFKFPFQAVKDQTMGGIHLTSSGNGLDILLHEIPTNILLNMSMITIDNIIGILVYPINGGIGLLPIIMLSIIAILLFPYIIFIKKIQLTTPEKILLLFSIVISITYLFTTMLGFNLHMETGILPDMRYFSLVYAPLIIASLSILSRTFTLINYKTIFNKLIVWFGIVLVVFTILLMILSNNGIMTITNANLTANILSIIIFAISCASIFDTIRTNRVDGLEFAMVLMISLPLIWQLFVSVITTKLYDYPMYLPLIEYIRKIIFG